MTLSVNHATFVLLWTHTECIKTSYIAILRCHTDCESLCWVKSFLRCITHQFFSETAKWHQMVVSGLWNTDEGRKSNVRVCVPLKRRWAFPRKDLHIRALPGSQLQPLTLQRFGFCVRAPAAESFTATRLSNENHSSQSSLPETKGQRNLGKLLKLQSNLL